METKGMFDFADGHLLFFLAVAQCLPLVSFLGPAVPLEGVLLFGVLS